MTASVLAVLALSVPADTLTLQETIDRYDPHTNAYLGSEVTWFGPDGRRLRVEERDSTGSAGLIFLVLHEPGGSETGAVYLESGAVEPSVELFSYSDDGRERTTTYVTKDGTPPERTVDELDAEGRAVRKRYYRADGKLYGEEAVSWTEDGDKAGWDFRYVGREGGASFRYTYRTHDSTGSWTERLMLRDGDPLRREVRSRTTAPVNAAGPEPAMFSPGVVSTQESETSPSFSADGKTLVFARYDDDWTEKRPFIGRLGEDGWQVEPIGHVPAVYNLAVSPNGETVVYSIRRDGEPNGVFQTSRDGEGGWSKPENLSMGFGMDGSYPSFTDHGDLLLYSPAGSEGDGIYVARKGPGGFQRPEPYYVPDSGTTFDGSASSLDGPLLVTRCFDGLCSPRDQNGLWLVETKGPETGNGRFVEGLPYAWGFQPVRPLNLLVFTDGEDILTVPLSAVAIDGSSTSQEARWADALIGEWEGVLEYLDYGDDKTLVTLPTGLVVSRPEANDTLSLAFSYGEPDGRTVSSRERLFDAGDSVFLGGMWTVEARDRTAESADYRIVLSRSGEDNGRPAVLRRLIVFAEGSLTITQTVTYEGSDEAFLRNEYRLTKRIRRQ